MPIITKESVLDGLITKDIKIKRNSRGNGCCASFNGYSPFSFGGQEAEKMTVEEYMGRYSMEDIAEKICAALAAHPYISEVSEYRRILEWSSVKRKAVDHYRERIRRILNAPSEEKIKRRAHIREADWWMKNVCGFDQCYIQKIYDEEFKAMRMPKAEYVISECNACMVKLRGDTDREACRDCYDRIRRDEH